MVKSILYRPQFGLCAGRSSLSRGRERSEADRVVAGMKMTSLAVLGQLRDESIAYVERKPLLTKRITGHVSNAIGSRIAHATPEFINKSVEAFFAAYVRRRSYRAPTEADYRLDRMQSILAAAGSTERKGLVFAVGQEVALAPLLLALSSIRLAAFTASTIGEMALGFTLLVEMSLQIQESFNLSPSMERASRAFGLAAAPTSEARKAAYLEGTESIYAEYLGERIFDHLKDKGVHALRHGATGLVNVVSSSIKVGTTHAISEEIADNSSEQSMQLAMNAAFRSYLERHPQFVSRFVPLVGIVVGSVFAVNSARQVFRANYHVSRLDYLEEIQRRLGKNAIPHGPH